MYVTVKSVIVIVIVIFIKKYKQYYIIYMLLYAKDLCINNTSINPNLITVPDDHIPNLLNDVGLALWHKVNKDVEAGNFKDTLYEAFIIMSNKNTVINKHAYGIRTSDNYSVKTGPILFSNLQNNGWIYTFNGSLYKIITLCI